MLPGRRGIKELQPSQTKTEKMTVCEREARRTTETKNASKSSNCPPEAMKSRNEEKEICFYSKKKGLPLVVETPSLNCCVIGEFGLDDETSCATKLHVRG